MERELNYSVYDTIEQVISYLSIDELITLYNTNNSWKNILNSSNIISLIAFHNNITGPFETFAQISHFLKNPNYYENMCNKWSTKLQCLLNAIENKNNILFYFLIKSMSVNIFIKDYINDYFNNYVKPMLPMPFLNDDGLFLNFIVFLVEKSIENNNTYAISKLAKLVPSGVYSAWTFNPSCYKKSNSCTIGGLFNNVDYITYLLYKYKSVEIMRLYFKEINQKPGIYYVYINVLVLDNISNDKQTNHYLNILFNIIDFKMSFKDWMRSIKTLQEKKKTQCLLTLIENRAKYARKSFKKPALYNLFIDYLILYNIQSVQQTLANTHILHYINYLISIVDNITNADKIALHNAVKSIFNLVNPDKNVLVYFPFRGFLLLCYEPKYSLIEILHKIAIEGADGVAIDMTKDLIDNSKIL
jgi:uncharacterized membrane protein